MRTMTVAVLFVFSIFGAQLVRLQGLDSSAVAAQALKQRRATETIPAMRGVIRSSDGVVLASSVIRETVFADQTAVCTYGTHSDTCDDSTAPSAIAAATAKLAPLLDTTPDALRPLLTGTVQYRYLDHNVTDDTWNKIEALHIPGIYRDRTVAATDRIYPQGATTASLVGFTLDDGSPGGGVEQMLDPILRGTPGSAAYEAAADGTVIPAGVQEITPAKNGRDVTLTINSNLQWYAQNALAAKVRQTRALSGTVVAMDVRTGRLLALASYPSFDPNNLAKATGSLANLAFNDVFEPGSTGKIMTVAAAMQEGNVTPTTPVVIPGQLHRYDTWFHDAEPHGTEYRTVAGALAQSSNLGAILMGETMRPTTLESYFRKFGLGSTSGIGFPGEAAGLLAPSQTWSGTQRDTVAFGQGLSVTAIQVASVFQTIANGGVRVPPRLVAGTEGTDGTYQAAPQTAGTRVVSTKVATELSRMLEGVVSTQGTAPQARIQGYRVAGKTGTADRFDPTVKRYRGKTASFIGYAPADNPQIVVAVILQRPIRGYYGGTVAAPVFHDVMTYALQALKVPPTGTTPQKVALHVSAAKAAADPHTLRDGSGGSAR
jgi:cell division protein FtsI (penicillin-binding protein 3)